MSLLPLVNRRFRSSEVPQVVLDPLVPAFWVVVKDEVALVVLRTKGESVYYTSRG